MNLELKIRLPNGVRCLRLFGSTARGDTDLSSDLDILAVLDAPLDKVASNNIKVGVETLFQRQASFSWYSQTRIREMFQGGHLFAWHIFLESLPITHEISADIIDSLGKPAVYEAAVEDINSLSDILQSIPPSIEACPANATYEAGVMFVCLRNIALCASWYSPCGLDFSRYSPYGLERAIGLRFPIAKNDYNALIKARMSGQRGIPYEGMDKNHVLILWHEAMGWVQQVRDILERWNYEYEFKKA